MYFVFYECRHKRSSLRGPGPRGPAGGPQSRKFAERVAGPSPLTPGEGLKSCYFDGFKVQPTGLTSSLLPPRGSHRPVT